MFVPAKYCDQCGAKLDADSKFCTSCGAKLPTPMEVRQPEQAARPQPESAKRFQPEPQPELAAQHQPEPQPEERSPFTKVEPEPQHQPESEPELAAQPQPEPQPKPQPELAAQPQPELQPEPQPESQPEPQSQPAPQQTVLETPGFAEADIPDPLLDPQPEPQSKDPEETLDQIPVKTAVPDYDGEETVYIGANAGFDEPESTEQRFSRLAPIAELKKERSGEKIVIDRPEFVLGKNPNHTDFAIRDNNTVSRIHASITWDEDGYKIVDLGSMNGTFVNGSKIGVDGELLKDGDVIELSDEIFRLSLREV